MSDPNNLDDDPFGGPRVAPAADLEYLLTPEPERSIGPMDVVGRTLHLLATRPLSLIALLVAGSLVFSVLTLVFGEVSSSITDFVDNPQSRKVVKWIATGGVFLHAWGISTVVQAPIVGAAIEARTEQRGLLVLFLRRGIRLLPVVAIIVVAITLLTFLVMIVAYGAVVVLGLVASQLPRGYIQMIVFVAGMATVGWLSLRVLLGVSLAVPVALVEELPAIASIKRSWTLTAGHRYAIGFGILLPVLVLSIAGIVLGSAHAEIGRWYNLGANIFLLLYATAMAPATYVAFREFVDGIAPEKLLTKNAPAPTQPSA